LHIPDHYLPYGAGIRACPGETTSDAILLLVTAHLLFYLQFTVEGKPDLEGELDGFVLFPRPYTLGVTARETVGEVAEDATLGDMAVMETVMCLLEQEAV